MFPPIDTRDSLSVLEAQQDFNAFNYWRAPISAFPDSSDDDTHEDEDGELEGAVAMYGSI